MEANIEIVTGGNILKISSQLNYLHLLNTIKKEGGLKEVKQ